jgi:hypothetical protein
MIRYASAHCACFIALSAFTAAAKVTPLPTPGNAVGILASDQPGKWLVITIDRETWFFVFPETQTAENGRICYWEGKPGVYGYVFDGEDGSREAGNVTLGGVSPKPPPPNPDVPDGLWKLTRTSHDYALKLPTAGQKYVRQAASNYTSTASEISSGKLTTADGAKSALKARNRATIPDADRHTWSAWDAAVMAVLVAHDTELSQSMARIAEAFSAIAHGLNLALEKLE